MDNKELTEKLGKSAGALTTKSNELKEVLTRCKEVFAILAKLDVLKQEIEKNAKEIAVIKEKIEVETTNLSKYTELEQNLSESLKDRQNLLEQATSDYATATEKYSELKKIVESFSDNKALVDGLLVESKQLKKLSEKVEKVRKEFCDASDDLKKQQYKIAETTNTIKQSNLLLAEKENRKTFLENEYASFTKKMTEMKTSTIDVSLVDSLIEVAKRVGYYNALAENHVVKEEEVKKAIEEVVKPDVPVFTKEILYDLFVKTFSDKDKQCVKDSRTQIQATLFEADKAVKNGYELINVLFDDYKTIPSMILSSERIPYVSVVKDNSGYTKVVHYKYSDKGRKHMPTKYRVLCYLLNAIKELHNVQYMDIIQTMNRLIEEDDFKVQYYSLIPSNSNYKFFNKKDLFVPVAVSETRFLALPKKYYTYEFMGALLEAYGHENVVCVCKKGGVIGID